MHSGPLPRAALLGSSRLALLVAAVPIFITFAFLHYHYAYVRSLRTLGSGGASSGGVAFSGKVKISSIVHAAATGGSERGMSRLRSLLHSSDSFGRTLRDGCELSSPEAEHATARAHSAARSLFSRNDFGGFLAKDLGLGGEGAIIGVGGGGFADTMLQVWNSSRLYLVDPWKYQPGLVDIGNVKDDEQEALLSETYSRLNAHNPSRFKVMRESSIQAASSFTDCSLAFVYIDDRRDYTSVLQDLIDYWPKVKPGGIIAVRVCVCVCVCVCV